MIKPQNLEGVPPAAHNRERLRAATQTLRGEGSSGEARKEALLTLRDLGGKARPALLLIVAALNDRDEVNRFHAYQVFCDLCSTILASQPGLSSALASLASADEKVRLEVIHRIVRIVPDVQEARAKGSPGWRALRSVLLEGRSAREVLMSQPQVRTLDETAFLKALPTSIHDPADPVVQAMRANPGRWIGWNEATREIYALTDDFNEALQSVAHLDGDPNVALDMAPGIHPAAPIHRPRRLESWESPDVLDDVHLLWGDSPDAWLDSPNPRLDGRRPREVVGTADEVRLRDLLASVRFGGTS